MRDDKMNNEAKGLLGFLTKNFEISKQQYNTIIFMILILLKSNKNSSYMSS